MEALTKEKRSVVQQGDTHNSTAQRELASGLSTETQEMLDRDAKVFLHQALSTPVMNVMESAEGPYIVDHDGNRYLDLHGNGVHNVGFNNREVITAIIRQFTDQLTFTPRRYTNLPSIEFAEKLAQLAPGDLNRVLFCPGGSEAVEMAVMLAKHVTGKWKTISFWSQYHGNTFQAATLSGNEHFTSGMGPMVPGAHHVAYPNYYRNPWGIDPQNQDEIDERYLYQIREIFRHTPDIAAIIGTTVSSTPYVPSLNYWQQVREICDEYGAFLIFDEIVCGLGRTGKLFACEHYVIPDVVVLGKSLGAGILPFAGIVTKDKYNEVGDFSIGHFTHEKSPICAAAGLAMLNYMEDNQVIENAAAMGRYLLQGFQRLAEDFACIGQVDGKGLLLSMDLVKSHETKERDEYRARAILSYCLQHGISFKVIDGNVITMRPSLIITREDADLILKTFRDAFDATA
ncbi:MAG: aspartate aminotransferase family protein [Bacteroidota bacterium]